MTGTALAALMHNPSVNNALTCFARRYTPNQENQEEYVQEALLRIGRECGDKDPLEAIIQVGRLGIQAAYRRGLRRVDKNIPRNVNGIYASLGPENHFIHDLTGCGNYMVRAQTSPWDTGEYPTVWRISIEGEE